ncbi:hypothetical protein P8452_14095 [Trifolium repens]|nr:hypothetical protein P8452_14095 [Trifolium repens]
MNACETKCISLAVLPVVPACSNQQPAVLPGPGEVSACSSQQPAVLPDPGEVSACSSQQLQNVLAFCSIIF